MLHQTALLLPLKNNMLGWKVSSDDCQNMPDFATYVNCGSCFWDVIVSFVICIVKTEDRYNGRLSVKQTEFIRIYSTPMAHLVMNFITFLFLHEKKRNNPFRERIVVE